MAMGAQVAASVGEEVDHPDDRYGLAVDSDLGALSLLRYRHIDRPGAGRPPPLVSHAAVGARLQLVYARPAEAAERDANAVDLHPRDHPAQRSGITGGEMRIRVEADLRERPGEEDLRRDGGHARILQDRNGRGQPLG